MLGSAPPNQSGRPRRFLFGCLVALILPLAALVALGMVLDIRKSERVDAMGQEVAAARMQRDLNQQTACVLVQQRLIDKGFDGYGPTLLDQAKCNGPMHQIGDRADLSGVVVAIGPSQHALNGCLMRRARWFVLDLASEACSHPSLSLPPPPAPNADEQTIQADEDTTRTAHSNALGVARLDRAMAALAKARDASQRIRLGETACNFGRVALPRAPGDGRYPVETVDYAALANLGKNTHDDDWWNHLNSPDVSTLLAADKSQTDRLAALDSWLAASWPLLVVYGATSRSLPEVIETTPLDLALEDRGHLKGWLLVVNVADGELLCQATLDVAGATGIKTYVAAGSGTGATRAALQTDARLRFFAIVASAAEASLARLSSQMKLLK